MATNPKLYPIVGEQVKRHVGPICQTSLENEPKTRKTQIQGEIGVKKAAKLGFENEPKRTYFRADFRGRKRAESADEPKKRTQ